MQRIIYSTLSPRFPLGEVKNNAFLFASPLHRDEIKKLYLYAIYGVNNALAIIHAAKRTIAALLQKTAAASSVSDSL